MTSATHPVRVVRWADGLPAPATEDHAAVEEPLEIRLDTRPVSITLRTPGHDDELAAGFLVSEGLIHRRSDVVAIRPHPRNDWGNVVDVLLDPALTVDFARLTRHVFAASSCGLCGKAGIDQLCRNFPPVLAGPTVSAAWLASLPGQLREAQTAFDRTGGLHAAALFEANGPRLTLREDIGRHNAVDKVLGRAFLDAAGPLSRHVLLVSGRTSFEIVQKAVAAGVPVLAAVSAPSSLAVEFAQANGQTLIGFLRDGRFNVYSHPERITP